MSDTESPHHLVLIADIIGSRQLADRKAVQQRLERVLGELNDHREQLLSPYTITLGDEFQALFSGADRVFPDLVTILDGLHPVGMRFALGIGSVTTAINRDQAIGMDGQAFYRARDLLEQMKKRDRVMAVAGLPDDPDELLQGALGLLNHHIRKWHGNRLAILRLLMQGVTVSAIAERLDITEQSVYKNIREGALESVLRIMDGVAHRMNLALNTTR